MAEQAKASAQRLNGSARQLNGLGMKLKKQTKLSVLPLFFIFGCQMKQTSHDFIENLRTIERIVVGRLTILLF